MRRFLLDASAVVKRYTVELGSPLVNDLFVRAVPVQRTCLMLGAAESAAILSRKRNRGDLSMASFTAAYAAFRAEIVDNSAFVKLSSDNDLIFRSLPLADRYAINANDAIVLQTALDLLPDLRAAGDDLVLVAADQRLVRAAAAEGIPTFNPETQLQTDLDILLALTAPFNPRLGTPFVSSSR